MIHVRSRILFSTCVLSPNSVSFPYGARAVNAEVSLVQQELMKQMGLLQEVNCGGKQLNEDWHELIVQDCSFKDLVSLAELTVKNCYGKAIRSRVTKMDEAS